MPKLCVFTGTRADYGLLKPVLKGLQDCPDTQLQILCSGTHLRPEFGYTVRTIEQDGFAIDARVDIGATGAAGSRHILRTMGAALAGYGEALGRLRPAWLILLGDRYEAFCAAVAATMHRLPIAHIHGGETTCGAVDESFRHAVTKMSHLHFTAAEPYRQRVIQLGEAPETVHNVGALGVQVLKETPLLDLAALGQSLGVALRPGFLLVTVHAATLDTRPASAQIAAVTQALARIGGRQFLFTKANADPGGEIINHHVQTFVEAFPERAFLFDSLGQQRYLSALKHAAAVVGNSSSGIIEAPSLKTPTVNIGPRQDGRVRAASVLDCGAEPNAILSCLQAALSPRMAHILRRSVNPYEQTDPAGRIVAALRRAAVTKPCLQKRFYDLQPTRTEHV